MPSKINILDAISVIANTIGTKSANEVLDAYMRQMASADNKQARVLVDVSEYLLQNKAFKRVFGQMELGSRLVVARREDDRNWSIETPSEAAARLIHYALTMHELNLKMVNTFFGVGLLGKDERDELINSGRLAA